MTIGHIISVQRMSIEYIDYWRSIPSWQLWQSTKTGRRWADVVFTDTPLRSIPDSSDYITVLVGMERF